jgi:SWI/SNF-related matrix-associated actin-dependent regulator 1 of chromatin subfamily A
VEALRYLSSVCDGAHARDGQGFNGRDTSFGKSLAEQSYDRVLSEKQQQAAIKMLQTYRTQLVSAGIELPEQASYEVKQRPERAERRTQDEAKKVVKVTRNNGTLTVRFPYDARLVAKVKALPERSWNKKEKAWRVPTRLAKEVLEMFPEAEVDGDVESLVEQSQTLAGMSGSAQSDFDVPGIKGQPLPYQRAGVHFLELADGRGIVADQMGLGKTLQSLAYLQLHPEKRPVVIVVPASLKINWQREIDKWMSTDEVVHVISGQRPSPLPDASIYIINYDIVTFWLDELLGLDAPVMIADEAHYCKNTKAKRSKAVKTLARDIPHVILLTGTPVTNRPVELFPLLNMVNPEAWPKFFPFAKRYCGAHHNGFGWDFTGASNLTELHQAIKPYVVRRTKSQVLTELPAKRRATLALSLGRKDRREYDRMIEEARVAIEEARAIGQNLGAEHLALIEKAKQAAARGKMKQAVEWISDFLETGEKLVVFATHKFVVAELMEAFDGQAVKVTGDDSQDQRQQAVDRFQADDSVRLFVGNIKAAGVGLTLTAASDVAFLEFAWTPGDHEQAEDRTHRIGQEDNVTAWYLVAEDTIDEKIVSLLEAKRQVVDEVTDGRLGRLKFSMLGELADEITKNK